MSGSWTAMAAAAPSRIFAASLCCSISGRHGAYPVVRRCRPSTGCYGEIAVSHLATYVDVSGRTFRDLAIVGLPTTLLIDRAGREIARLVGPAAWDAPDTIAVLRRLIGRRTGALAPPIGVRLAVSDDAAGARRILNPLKDICS